MLVRLMGGLGNQMFIYAFAKAMSLKGYPILLDATYLKNDLHEDAFKNKDSVEVGHIKRGGGKTYDFLN